MAALPDFRPNAGVQPAAPQATGNTPSLPDFRPDAQFKQRAAGMSHEQMADYYHTSKPGDPFADYLAKVMSQPQQGETPEQTDQRLYGQKGTVPTKTQSAIGGAANTMSYGFGDEMAAGLHSITGGDSYENELWKQRQMDEQLLDANPKSYLAGSVAGAVPGAALMGGAGFIGAEGALGRTALTAGAGAADAGLYGFGEGQDGVGNRLASAGENAVIGAGLGLVPGAAVGAYKGAKWLASKPYNAALKTFKPAAAAEKQLAKTMSSDRSAYQKLMDRELAAGNVPPEPRFLTRQAGLDAEGAGQRTMVGDYGGDQSRKLLKSAANQSAEADDILKGAAASRQSRQADRVTDAVQDNWRDTLDPHEITANLQKQADDINTANYTKAKNHPNAEHMWSPSLQNAISSDFGKVAVKRATSAMKDEAMSNGHPFFEPVFSDNALGRTEFLGFRAPNGDMVKGHGLSLSFWDQVKKAMDRTISEAAPEEGKRMIGLKNRMIASLDQAVPDYKTARGGAKEFFDLIGKRARPDGTGGGQGGALKAGADYFKSMNSFGVAEARHNLESLSAPERELFSRGYAGELVTRISKMGEAEDVNKLFKSPQSRMKMRDALGDTVANQLEAFTQREMVQGLLGKHLGANSTTAAQLLADEALKTGIPGVATYAYTGDWRTTAVMTAAMRGGFHFTNKKLVMRYSKALAELATSDDPEVIARILKKVSADPGYMNFSRAAANGAAGAGTTAGRAAQSGAPGAGNGPLEITVPGGGLPVAGQGQGYAAGGAVKKGLTSALEMLQDAIKSTDKKVDISGMPRIFDLSNLHAVPDVEQRALERYVPKHGVSDRLDRLLKNKSVIKQLSDAIERGSKTGGREWYKNDPLRDVFIAELGAKKGDASFRDFMGYVAATSPRSKVPENARNASYYYAMSRNGGVPQLTDKNPAPYGHIAQRLHKMNAQRIEAGGFDPLNNPKPASFVENLTGNQMPGTIDTHATRYPAIMSKDPAWLSQQVAVKNADGTKGYINPRKMYEAGDLTVKDALKRPAFWESKPNDNEYAALEDLYKSISGKHGLTTAQAQASSWAEGAKVTGLGSIGTDPFIKVLEDRVLITAKKLGIDPKEVLRQMIVGNTPLLRDGGSVRSALSTAA